MPRPNNITQEDIARWDKIINEELPETIANNVFFKEVCYAGQWLGEQLKLLGCHDDYAIRIVYTAGKLSYGRDTWEISSMLLNSYERNELEYEEDPDFNLN
jgi:hypothetical protein